MLQPKRKHIDKKQKTKQLSEQQESRQELLNIIIVVPQPWFKSTMISTCNGVLSAHNSVNETISLKYIVTHWKDSASTEFPFFNCSATELQEIHENQSKLTLIVVMC